MHKIRIFPPLILATILLITVMAIADRANSDAIQPSISVPTGFSLSVFASDLQKVRFLRITSKGNLLASLPSKGQIIWLSRDTNGDGQSDTRRVLLTGLNRPHGLDFYKGWLYVAETDAVFRVPFDREKEIITGSRETIIENIPGGGHWTRTLRTGPDDKLYLTIGSSCNVCIEDHPWRSTMLRFSPDGDDVEIFAEGLRNSVGFDWQPETGKLFATENGRDNLGDDVPPDELNHIIKGGFYGWPYHHGFQLKDPEFGDRDYPDFEESRSPAYGFRAHVAPLGITFLRNKNLPAEYQHAALVALHGSWNRSRKDGYEVVSLHFSADGTVTERSFITGFEKREDVIGRPVDVVEGLEGEIYVSDDFSGRIYRITYQKNNRE